MRKMKGKNCNEQKGKEGDEVYLENGKSDVNV